MSRKLEDLESEALQLDPDARAQLAEKLLESLDDLSPSDIEALWADEAERRLRDLREGRSREIPGPDALRRALSELS